MGKIDFGTAFSKGWDAFSKNIGILLGGYCLTMVISMTIVLGPAIYAGFYFMVLKTLRGQKAEINDLFVGFSDFGRFFVGGLLILGLGICGLLCCCVGIFVVSGLTIFLLMHMVDKGKGAGEALQDCWAHFKVDWLMLILFAFVVNLVAQAGVYALYFGILLSAPFAACVTGAAYLDVFGNGLEPMPAQPILIAEAVEKETGEMEITE
jgi:uncharacterized membrane protein